jgi:hypothetical protein
MGTWIRGYGEGHPSAAQWARGSQKVRHTLETQGRIFRMAEQFRSSQDWSNIGTLFSMLQELDDVVDTETCRTCRPSAISAAAAGLVGYKLLFGKMPALRDHDWPEGFERADEREAELATMGLRAEGFDPIVIDGIDPAAYLWGLFEMCKRQESCAEVKRVQEHLAVEPRCLAVIPEEPIRESLPKRIPAAAERELVVVRR